MLSGSVFKEEGLVSAMNEKKTELCNSKDTCSDNLTLEGLSLIFDLYFTSSEYEG